MKTNTPSPCRYRLTPSLDCILLVDDDPATLFLHQVVLEEGQYAQHIYTTSSVPEALAYLRAALRRADDTFRIPQLILLDLEMPHLNGWDFMKVFEASLRNQLPDTQVVILSNSLPENACCSMSTQLGIAGFRNKPLTERVARKILEKYFSM